MQTERLTLENGLPILYHRMKHAPTTTILILVKVGSRYEDETQRGISHFLEHMMFKGTKKRPDSQRIVTKLDELGASYNAFTSFEYTGYWIKVRNDKASLAMDILSDMYQNSLFKQADIDTERGAIQEEMNMVSDNPMRKVVYNYQELLYGDTPLGRPIIGTKEHVANFQRSQFTDYFNEKYSSSNSIVVVSGGVDRSILTKAKQLFPKVRTHEAPKYISAELQADELYHHENKATDQIHLITGFPTHSMSSEKRYVSELTSTILGGYMSSRLFREIREKRGLAYYVRAMNFTFSDIGSMMIRAGVQVGKAAKTTELIKKELTKIPDTLTQEEFKRAKEHIKGQVSVGFETSDQVAMEIGFRELFMEEPMDINRELKKFDEVTVDQVKDYAKEYFVDKNMYISLIGPVSQTESKQLQKIAYPS